MWEDSDERRTDQIRSLLRDLGKWPEKWGTPTQAVLLELYDLYAAQYQAAGRPLGDSLESLLRWWREA